MGNTKIDWCDRTLNPVIGCKHGCPYCYARKLNDRFHFIDCWEKPQFFKRGMEGLGTKKPSSFFMDSMSDISYWPRNVIHSLTQLTEGWLANVYIFLTKDTTAVDYFKGNVFDIHALLNLRFGYSCGTERLIKRALGDPSVRLDFLSVEPIEEDLPDFGKLLDWDMPELVIIGAETGNRKGKVVCDPIWVTKIVSECDSRYIKVFMKDSLKSVMGSDFRRDKLPWPCAKEDKDGK